MSCKLKRFVSHNIFKATYLQVVATPIGMDVFMNSHVRVSIKSLNLFNFKGSAT